MPWGRFAAHSQRKAAPTGIACPCSSLALRKDRNAVPNAITRQYRQL